MKRYISLGLLVLLFEGVGGALGMLTSPEIAGWYSSLAKSPFNPPSAAFGIVWPILYLMLAISVWLIYKEEPTPKRNSILALFFVHMLLNWAWTPVFFTSHQVFGGLVILALIVATAVALIALLWRYKRAAALLLIPYIAWTAFASHLNYYIWQNN